MSQNYTLNGTNWTVVSRDGETVVLTNQNGTYYQTLQKYLDEVKG